MREKKTILIIGCGRLGGTIANTLYEKGNDILIIDKFQDSFRRISSSFGGISVCMDATNIDDLKQLEIYEYDVAIVVTEKDTINIMLSEILKEEFKVKKVIIRLINQDRKIVCDKNKINFISPETLILKEINKLI